MMRCFLFILVLALLMSGVAGAAQIVDLDKLTKGELIELRATIDKMIDALDKDELNAEEPSLPSTDTALYSLLEKGARGDAVKALQARLKELGFYSISIDGDYGNGTVNAVNACQKYNGLEETGKATPEFQALIWSDNVKRIEVPDITISSFTLRKSYGYYFSRPTFINNTEYDVDAISYCIRCYNSYGERIFYSSPLPSLADIANNADYYTTIGSGELAKISLKASGKLTLKSSNEIDFYSFDQDAINVAKIAVVRYHTTDGQTIIISDNDQIWYGSDGSISKYEYENAIEPTIAPTNDIRADAESFMLGYTLCAIPNYIADAAGLPMGGVYLSSITEGSIADEAGLKAGDVIVKIGEVWTHTNDDVIIAKAKLLQENEAVVKFYRRGELNEIVIEMQ